MATLSAAQIYALARNAGLTAASATIATAVALGESGGRTDAQGDVGLQDSKWGPSVGLWQIRSVKAEYGTGSSRDASRLTDPAFNARSMVSISNAGKNWRPWTVFTSGAYRKHLKEAIPAAVDGASVLNPMETPTESVKGLGDQVSGALDGWSKGAMTVGLKIVAGLAAAGLVIAGAVHTVK